MNIDLYIFMYQNVYQIDWISSRDSLGRMITRETPCGIFFFFTFLFFTSPLVIHKFIFIFTLLCRTFYLGWWKHFPQIFYFRVFNLDGFICTYSFSFYVQNTYMQCRLHSWRKSINDSVKLCIIAQSSMFTFR